MEGGKSGARLVKDATRQRARRASGEGIDRSTYSQIIRRTESRNCCATIRRVSQSTSQSTSRAISTCAPRILPCSANARALHQHHGESRACQAQQRHNFPGTWYSYMEHGGYMLHLTSSFSLSDENAEQHGPPTWGASILPCLCSPDRKSPDLLPAYQCLLNAASHRQMTRASYPAPNARRCPAMPARPASPAFDAARMSLRTVEWSVLVLGNLGTDCCLALPRAFASEAPHIPATFHSRAVALLPLRAIPMSTLACGDRGRDGG